MWVSRRGLDGCVGRRGVVGVGGRWGAKGVLYHPLEQRELL